MATPSLAMIPSAYADSKVYSVLPNNGDGDFTFNRDSSATRVGQNGLIQTVGFFGNELVVNGDFATDSDWTKGTGTTISGGNANFVNATGVSLFQDIGTQTGTVKVEFTVTNYTSGTLNVYSGANQGIGTVNVSANALGKYIAYVVRTGGNVNIIFGSNDSFTGSIDFVSVKEVLGDQPRLNYDISNGVVQSCPSLLLEPASTNIITYSEDFSNSYWTKSGSSITSDTTTSPDGSLNADKLVEDTSTGQHQMYPPSTSGADAVRTISFFVKPDGVTKIGIRNNDGKYISYDISTGTTLDKTITNDFVSTDMTNGWKRLSVSWDDTTPATGARFFLLDNAYTSGNPLTYSYTGNGTNGIYLYGFQTEQQTYATSYIPNFGQSGGVTRAAETCFGAGNAATFNSTEGVLYAEINPSNVYPSSRYVALSDGSTSNRVIFGVPGNSSAITSFISSGGSVVSTMSTPISISQFHKIALKYKANDFALWVDGVKVATDTSGAAPIGLNQLLFTQGDGGNNFYGNTKDLRVYNEALTDAQLQTLTTL